MSEANLNSHCGGSQSSRCFQRVPIFQVLSLIAVDINSGPQPKAEFRLVDKTGRKAEHETRFFHVLY